MLAPKLTVDYNINGKALEGLLWLPETIDYIFPGTLLAFEQQQATPPYPEEDIPVIREHHEIDGIAFPLIAVENVYYKYDIDHQYWDGIIPYRHCLPGDIFIGIADTDAVDIQPGTYVSSAGNGKLHSVPDGFLYDRTIIGCALAAPGTAESYKYFAVNGVSLEEVYARSESEYYLTAPMEIVMLSDRFPVEVI